MKNLLFAASFAAGVTAICALPGSAFAIPVAGASSGAFSNPTCNGLATCTLSGAGTVLTYGDSIAGFSSLSFTGQPIGLTTDTLGATIGTLTWTNNIDPVAIFGNQFGVDLTITLTLTAPPGGGSTNGPITLVETLQNFGFAPDTATLPDLSGFVITIPGGPLTIDNFRYVDSLSTSNDNLAGLVWTLGENRTGSVNILADFTSAGRGEGDPPAVPEPTTLGLLGVGLVGLAFALRRRRRIVG